MNARNTILKRGMNDIFKLKESSFVKNPGAYIFHFKDFNQSETGNYAIEGTKSRIEFTCSTFKIWSVKEITNLRTQIFEIVMKRWCSQLRRRSKTNI